MLIPLLFAAVAEGDGDLIRRLRAREPAAVGELYDRYGRAVYSLVRRIVRDPSAAEDLTQETFLRAWSRSHLLDEARTSLGAWLLTVARNQAVDFLRQRQRRLHDHAAVEELEDNALLDGLERLLLNADRAKRLQRAFARLPERQQQVIELAYYEDLTQTEMAARLQQPLGTVKTWMRSALRTLREELVADPIS